ncbi:MAG: hypothetical protein HOA18_17340 [Rhodospirillaceae bacterium]|jgi:hypothetical protein|nr:hypothetical protein [Rhodospirillaceae bacterium]
MTEPDTPARVTVVPRPAVTTHTEVPALPLTSDAKPPNGSEARRAAIKATIEQLDLSDPAHVTEGGKPDATVLSDLLGWQVSAKERDAVWSEIGSASSLSRVRK